MTGWIMPTLCEQQSTNDSSLYEGEPQGIRWAYVQINATGNQFQTVADRRNHWQLHHDDANAANHGELIVRLPQLQALFLLMNEDAPKDRAVGVESRVHSLPPERVGLHRVQATTTIEPRSVDEDKRVSISSSVQLLRERRVPELYRLALSHQWAQVALRARIASKEAKYVHTDGTTTLHVAVISRASYSNCLVVSADLKHQSVRSLWGDCDIPAPTDVIRVLIKAYPNSAYRRCKKVGYTPLAYASLVPPLPGQREVESTGSELSFRTDIVGNHEDQEAFERAKRRRVRLQTGEEGGSLKNRYLDRMILGVQEELPEDLFDESEKVVRILIKNRKKSLSVLTDSGLSPVGIHVVSYSQMRGCHQPCSPNGLAHPGRTSVSVLRVLLEHDPRMARQHLAEMSSSSSADFHCGLSTSPLELMYKCNIAMIQGAISEHDDHRRALNINEGKAGLPSSFRTWWLWQWTVLLLKYGTLHVKKKGAPFCAVHAAALLEGCPVPILMLAMKAFPSNIGTPCDMTGENRYPLHWVCTWCARGSKIDDAVVTSRKGVAIDLLLRENREAAARIDAHGKTPLCLALESQTQWNRGVRKLVRVYPQALGMRDPSSGMYLFMVAAAAADRTTSTEDKQHKKKPYTKQAKKDNIQLGTIYEVIRANPPVLAVEQERLVNYPVAVHAGLVGECCIDFD